MNGISALIKEAPWSFLTLPTVWDYEEKTLIQKRAEADHTGNLISGLQAPELRSVCCL